MFAIYFYPMIKAQELRLGNYLLKKINTRIVAVRCDYTHFELLAKDSKDFYPVVLQATHLEKAGFIENKKYPLLPEAREFVLALPVKGSQQNEIKAYIKNNKECFARAVLNNLPISNNIYHLHQLQNLYHALTGSELHLLV
ncbi:MAG: hypothetical protein C4330_02005 [Chitinophagaceae bacterium]